MTEYDAAVIQRALDHLPTECHYHGDNLTRDYGMDRGPCCDTGKAALARREAEAALKRGVV